ncbi:MAG: adenylate/guanylate cyclase domain-containing protein [Sneathiellaceae bacterium]
MADTDLHRAEELDGIRLGFRLRLLILPAGMALVLVLVPWPQSLFYLPFFLLICACGYLHYRLRRSPAGRPWQSYAFALVDVVLITLAVILPNPLFADPLPIPLVLRFNAASFLVLIIAMAAFSLSPRLVLFTGLAVVASWTAAVLVVLGQPGVESDLDRIGPDRAMTNADVFAAISNPNFVDLGVELQRVVILLLLTLAATEIARRSRAFATRHAAAVRARASLERYFPPNLVSELVDSHEPFAMRRDQPAAVLFADLVGFTALAERLSAADMFALLQHLHGLLETVVFRHGGTLNKFLGDGAMITFGTPRQGANDAGAALACILDLQAEMAVWNASRAAAGQPPLRLAVGAHYGPVVLGDVGSRRHFEFAVLGDTVNVAARLEEATRELRCTALASEALLQQARRESGGSADSLLARFAPPRRIVLRGRAEDLEVRSFPATDGSA